MSIRVTVLEKNCSKNSNQPKIPYMHADCFLLHVANLVVFLLVLDSLVWIITIAMAIIAPWRIESTTSDVRGSSKEMASLNPIQAQEIPTARAAP